MKKIILFTGSSLDGLIARKDGGIDWLFDDGDYGYKEFYDSIDTTLTGHNTYKQALTFTSFPFYPEKRNFVFGKQGSTPPNHPVTFISADMVDFVLDLKSGKGKNIWLVGGGQLNTLFWNAGLIDELVISVHPVWLGEGISLLSGKAMERKTTLLKCTPFDSGLVQLTYSVH